ncbi:efflux RND transporter permease subunit [Desulforamulus hydrothermalis]|uniref:Acriflavin resistance protein n=1 Tax=Desulforamulus hydrothermalis Lam5 = DSM 18033 TaxID=1121428 RepID=K8EHQ9_9FIRM|nr:efflux RND transporter permease subunit [Desulforamulus hydrothermalis]CCO08171.1 Acriflavin resistance protein [Desulforamulus hydrothermalis Lam5 = DSM 18033]SHH23263.1 hydrophobic/amphiphilic exporter-1, HAE1 family [Desulforamulus hydrothermalis Lam5 = DSM 18033]
MHITELSVKRPKMMTMVILVFVILGLYTYRQIGVELYPAVNTPFVSISVSYPGAGAEEIETQIVKPIEDAVSSLSRLKTVTSTASAGSANINLEFALSADADQAAIDVQKKMDALRRRLPDGADDPVVIKRDINAAPVMLLALSGDSGRTELYDLANDVIKERLQRLAGVSEVAVFGGLRREIRIEVDKNKLTGYGLSINQIVNRLKAENINDPSGRLDRPEAEYNVRVLGEFRSVQEIEEIAIPTASGYAVPLKAVATVTDGYQEVRVHSRVNGQNAIGIQIYKQSDASMVAVGQAVKQELAALQTQLPPGTSLKISRDNSDFVQRSVNGTRSNIIEGIITTGLVLFLFLRQWRASLIVLLAIPTSLMATVMMMYFCGFTFNMMSLMGLALCIGILVDDSIVILENIHRHLHMGKTPWQAAIEGRREIGMAAIAITLSDVVVFAPLAFMNGMIGQFFRQFGLTIVFATLFSLFVSFTLTPMLASRLYKEGDTAESARPTRKSLFDILWQHTVPLGQQIKSKYTNMLLWSLSNRKKVLVLSALAFFLSLSLIPLKLIGTEFMPRTDEGGLTVSLEMPVGTPLEKTNEVLRRLEHYIGQIPDVQYYNTMAGSGGRGGAGGANTGRIEVQLRPKQQRQKSAAQIAEEIRKQGMAVKDAKVFVAESDSRGGGGGSAVRILVAGHDPEQINLLADQVKEKVAKVQGVTDARTDWSLGQPEIQIKVDHNRAAHYGLSVQEVAGTARTAVNGQNAGVLRDGEQEVNITVKMANAQLQDIESLQNLLINSNGIPVALGQVANLEYGSGPKSIRREDKQRVITVSAGIKERPLGDVMADIRKELAGIQLPAGCSIKFSGQDQSMRESFSELISALILSVVLVYMVLVMLYESFSTPLIRMLSLPLGIVGALTALALTKNNINIFTLIGIIMLDGLVAKNGTLLIDYTHTLLERGRTLKDALTEAAVTRLKPILMTTVTMVAGMLPTALSITEGAENRSGMAWVLIGGLLTSTVFTLFVIPVVYTIFDDYKTKWRHRRFSSQVSQPAPEITA